MITRMVMQPGRPRVIYTFGDSILDCGHYNAYGVTPGGLLVDNVSWESVFYLNVPVAIATIALGIPYLLESRESHRDPIDWPGVRFLM